MGDGIRGMRRRDRLKLACKAFTARFITNRGKVESYFANLLEKECNFYNEAMEVINKNHGRYSIAGHSFGALVVMHLISKYEDLESYVKKHRSCYLFDPTA